MASKQIPNKPGAKGVRGNKTTKRQSEVPSNAKIKSLASQEIWMREFNPDYDQIMLRISSAESGLGSGGAPGHAQ